MLAGMKFVWRSKRQMIEISHLTKKYGDHTAVKDLSLKIEPGRIYGFLGPNGAGKSTTMNIITGYLAATEGTVTIDGHDIFKEPVKAKSHIGYLPEIPPLYPDMTVLEYLTFAAELKGIPGKERVAQVDESIIMAGLSAVAGRLIRNLSKGYKQRVGLAQAILGNPDIIILDEPTAGLDPAQIIEVRDLIRELGKEHTVILSSHILTEISEVCNYVFIISKGKLVASDETHKLLTGMSGSRETDITVTLADGNDPEVSQIEDVFGKIAGVQSVEATGESPDGGIMVKIQSDTDTDIRADIFKACISGNMILLEMSSRSRSLEDVFMELTQTDEPDPDDTDDEDKKVDDESADTTDDSETEDDTADDPELEDDAEDDAGTGASDTVSESEEGGEE